MTKNFPYDKKFGFEVFIIELLPGCTHVSTPHQKGVVEHVISVSGDFEVFFYEKWHTIKQHEGIYFAADFPHGYRNLSKTPIFFHNIIHYERK